MFSCNNFVAVFLFPWQFDTNILATKQKPGIENGGRTHVHCLETRGPNGLKFVVSCFYGIEYLLYPTLRSSGEYNVFDPSVRHQYIVACVASSFLVVLLSNLYDGLFLRKSRMNSIFRKIQKGNLLFSRGGLHAKIGKCGRVAWIQSSFLVRLLSNLSPQVSVHAKRYLNLQLKCMYFSLKIFIFCVEYCKNFKQVHKSFGIFFS